MIRPRCGKVEKMGRMIACRRCGRKAAAFSTAVALFGLLFFACAPGSVKTAAYGPANAPGAVLIAAQSSRFKDALLSALVAELGQLPVRTDVVDLRRATSALESGYDVVVLINTCMAWQADPAAMRFLDAVGDKSRVILVTTAGDPGWRADIPGVDAITAASAPDRAVRLASEIAAKVRSRL